MTLSLKLKLRTSYEILTESQGWSKGGEEVGTPESHDVAELVAHHVQHEVGVRDQSLQQKQHCADFLPYLYSIK